MTIQERLEQLPDEIEAACRARNHAQEKLESLRREEESCYKLLRDGEV